VLPVSVAGAAFAAALLTYLLTGGAASGTKRFPHCPHEGNAEIRYETGHTGLARLPARAVSRKDEPSATDGPKPPTDSSERIVGATLPSGNRPSFHLSKIRMPSVDLQLSRTGYKVFQAQHTVETVQTSQVRSLPTLKVSGIAWQKDGSDRLAVVNGMPVTEGMNIDGARVEEIFQDKVRFSFEKRAFDVVVGK
jgi:hypothetical protein